MFRTIRQSVHAQREVFLVDVVIVNLERHLLFIEEGHCESFDISMHIGIGNRLIAMSREGNPHFILSQADV